MLPDTTRAPVLMFELFVVLVIVTMPLVLILPVAPIPPRTCTAPVTLLVEFALPLTTSRGVPATVVITLVAFDQ
jgi:hypothetical protein